MLHLFQEIYQYFNAAREDYFHVWMKFEGRVVALGEIAVTLLCRPKYSKCQNLDDFPSNNPSYSQSIHVHYFLHTLLPCQLVLVIAAHKHEIILGQTIAVEGCFFVY